MSLVLNNVDIEFREDGFINATQICKAGGKKFNHWYSLDSTKKLIEGLKKDLNVKEIIDRKVGGNHSGSWVHPRLALTLAMWISPNFGVKVSEWIEEWKNYSPQNLDKFNKAILDLEPSLSLQKEKKLQSKYAKILDARREVETPVGFIDLLTEDKIIEIKICSNWKSALGQLIAYGYYYPSHEKWLYIFDCSQTNTENIIKICAHNNIMVEFIE